MRGVFARRRTVGRAVDVRNYWIFVIVFFLEFRIEMFRIQFSAGIYRRIGGRLCSGFGELLRCVLSFDSQLFQVFFAP